MTESNPPSTSESTDEGARACFDNGVIDDLLIQSISFGAIVMAEPGNVEERGSVLLLLAPCQKTFKQVLTAARDGFKHFKIEYKDANLEVCSTWTFHGAFVKGIDFGTQGGDETPPQVKCEVCYELIEIDGVKL